MSTDSRVRVLLDAHLPDLHAYARLLMRSAAEADDLCQDVCVEVLQRPDLLLAGNHPGAYLRGMARHLAGRVGRLRSRHPSLDEAIGQAWDHAAQQEADPQDALLALRRCLEQLSPRARALLDGRYARELSAETMADQHAMGVDAVRMALMRARQALATCMAAISGHVSAHAARNAP